MLVTQNHPWKAAWFERDVCVRCASYITTQLRIDNGLSCVQNLSRISLMWLHLLACICWFTMYMWKTCYSQLLEGETGGVSHDVWSDELWGEERQVLNESLIKPLIHLRLAFHLQNLRPDAGQHLPGQTVGQQWLLRDTETLLHLLQVRTVNLFCFGHFTVNESNSGAAKQAERLIYDYYAIGFISRGSLH